MVATFSEEPLQRSALGSNFTKLDISTSTFVQSRNSMDRKFSDIGLHLDSPELHTVIGRPAPTIGYWGT